MGAKPCVSNTGSKAANSASKASSKASALTPALRSADSAACTEAACATSLGSTKLMPMPITATLRPPLRTVSIKMPPNLSAPITKSFGHLICACTPSLCKACRQASAATNASAPNSCCGRSNAQPKLNIRHSPKRFCQLLPCRPRPRLCWCATTSARWAVCGDCLAFSSTQSLLEGHSFNKAV